MENTNATGREMIVNNTTADLRDFGAEAAIRAAVATGAGLPDAIADLFAVEVVTVAGGERRIVVQWA
jgi:hypothetical protein